MGDPIHFRVAQLWVRVRDLIEAVRGGEHTIYIYKDLRDCVEEFECLEATNEPIYKEALMFVEILQVYLNLFQL